MVIKEGYENGEKVIEILDGKLDLVLYNNEDSKNHTFYFFRFKPQDIFEEKLSREVNIHARKDMEVFLKERGLGYDELVQKLLDIAVEKNMKERYDM